MSNYTTVGLLESSAIRKQKTNTYLPTVSSSFIKKALIALLFIITFSSDSFATHFRGGNITWRQAGGNTIEFTISSTWRRSYPAYGVTNPNVGALVNLGTITFGDGTSQNIIATVNSIDIAEDFINTTWVGRRTYTTAGNFTVNAFNSCCTISTLREGNNDVSYNLQTIVNVGAPFNSPPVSSLPVEYGISTGQSAATFTIPYFDPDGDVVTFRASTQAESGLLKPLPTGLTITPAGVVTFNTVGLQVDALYGVQVMMSDGKTKVPVEFIIEIVGPSQPPVFLSPIAPNNVFNVLPGNNVSFTVAARDPDAGQFVTLSPVSIPLGSIMTAPLPITGAVNSVVTSVFSWTPTASQVGSRIITFAALDNVGVQKFTPVTINVLCPLSTTVSSKTTASCPTSPDGSANITVQNFTSTANLIFAWSGPNGFTAQTQNISNVKAGNYSVRVSDNANGCFNITPVTIAAIPDVTPPTIACPADIPCVEATSPAGAVVTYPSVTATDDCNTVTVSSVLPSGSVFPVGVSTVIATATDGSNNLASCSFTVTVCDRTPPTIQNTPNDIPFVEATSPAGAAVYFTNPTATDIVDGAVSVYSVSASGSVFPIGTSTVVSTTTDAHGNTASTSFTVTVCDRTPPTIQNTPNDIPCVEATGSAGAVVYFTNPTATDIVDGAVSVVSLPASGSVFPIGISTVVSTAMDAHGNTSSTSFTIAICDRTVIFDTPNDIPCVEATSAAGAVVYFTNPSATDIVDGAVSVYSVPASGNVFPIGTTTVVSTATDANGNTATSSFAVTVQPSEAPSITAPTAITSCTGTGIVLGSPFMSDNCGVPSVSNNAPMTFPIGTTTVIWTATDNVGNTTTATQSVTVTEPTAHTTTIVACDTYTWDGPLGNGNIYTSSGIFTHNTINAGGCPHTETLNLTINQSTTHTTTVTACDSYTWSAPLGNGNVYTASGTFTHVSTNAAGCTHTETLVLTINQSTAHTTTVTACDSYTWSTPLGNGNVYTASGTFTHVSTNAAGCSHTETLKLTINPIAVQVPNCVYVNYGYGSNCTSLTAIGTGGNGALNYTWNTTNATGATVQVCPTTTTTYSVTVKDALQCSVTKSVTVQVVDVRCGSKNEKVQICHNGSVLCVSPNAVAAHLAHGDKLGTCASAPCAAASLIAASANNVSVALQHKREEMEMLLYPNPAQNMVNLTLEHAVEGEATLQVLDITGKVFLYEKQTLIEGENALTLDIAAFPSGLYFVKILTIDNQLMVQKLQIMH
jgi:HYR domain/Secretion system C-terminal sorting domain